MRRPTRSIRRAAGALLAVAFLLPLEARAAGDAQPRSSATQSVWTSSAAIGFDAVILRPLGFAAFLVGSAAFVPALLLTAANGRDSIDAATELFVTVPAQEVFQRKLGDF